jgi:hypothetical protein
MLLSTEFLFALSMSFVGTGARCRLGFSRKVDAASYRTASLRAKVGTQHRNTVSSQQVNMGILKRLLRRRARTVLA